jgi:hypothetical protein
VISAIDQLRQGSDGRKLFNLYRAMSGAAGIDHSRVTEELFLTGFNVRQVPSPPGGSQSA